MTKLETIQSLAILGGLVAAISPVISLVVTSGRFFYLWMAPFYTLYDLGIVLFVLLFLSGILTCVMAIRAAGYALKMPQRAASDLIGAGVLVLVVGIISLVNILAILSGILVLVAGVECNNTWHRIQRARRQTGWPFVTVATAAGSTWTRRISCRFCGAPLVVYKASAHGPNVHIEMQCPLDKTFDKTRLPLSQLESWTPVVADRLHRCEKCGERTAALIVIGQTGTTSRLRAYCPNRHFNPTFRRIWTPLYPHIARIPQIDVGFQDRPSWQQVQPTFQGVYPRAMTQPQSISASKATITHTGQIGFCTQCGVKIEASDIYCYRCGHQIQ
ncbi:MAG: hypothetical protein ACFFCH_10765 [Promethearchaeota archaeon]